jgi:hypothetical protein
LEPIHAKYEVILRERVPSDHERIDIDECSKLLLANTENIA